LMYALALVFRCMLQWFSGELRTFKVVVKFLLIYFDG